VQTITRVGYGHLFQLDAVILPEPFTI